MDKRDVYKLIGYHGEYNDNIKRAIRKLLKENHPDNKGDREKFELINVVKKELESGKVSYHLPKEDNHKSNHDIDYDYCYQMINTIKSNKDNLVKELNEKKKKLNNYEEEYRSLYHTSLDMENNLLSNPYINKMRNIKILSIVLLILMIISFIISVLKNSNILFMVFITLSLICIYIIQKNLLYIHKIGESNKKRFSNYIKMHTKIQNNTKKQVEIKKDIYEIERKIINMENDLRFYKNLLK